jgi:hypothetical protein
MSGLETLLGSWNDWENEWENETCEFNSRGAGGRGGQNKAIFGNNSTKNSDSRRSVGCT